MPTYKKVRGSKGEDGAWRNQDTNKFVSASAVKRATSAKRVQNTRKGGTISTGGSRSRSSSSRSSRGSSKKTKTRSKSMARPSITKIAALTIPVVAAVKRANDEVGFNNDPAGAARDAMGEYVSFYTGIDPRDGTFSIADAAVGLGPLAAAKIVIGAKRTLGNPSFPGPVTL